MRKRGRAEKTLIYKEKLKRKIRKVVFNIILKRFNKRRNLMDSTSGVHTSAKET